MLIFMAQSVCEAKYSISAGGYAVFATTIPVLLVAGLLSQRWLTSIRKIRGWFRGLFLLYVGLVVLGTVFACIGAAQGGLSAGGDSVVWSALFFSAGFVILAAAFEIFPGLDVYLFTNEKRPEGDATAEGSDSDLS